MGFKENLKNELTFQGILVKELSQKTGISKRTIDNYLRENSSMPPADYAVKIAKALNTSVEYLVNGEIDKTDNLNYKSLISLYSKLDKEDQNYFLKLMQGIIKIKS